MGGWNWKLCKLFIQETGMTVFVGTRLSNSPSWCTCPTSSYSPTFSTNLISSPRQSRLNRNKSKIKTKNPFLQFRLFSPQSFHVQFFIRCISFNSNTKFTPRNMFNTHTYFIRSLYKCDIFLHDLKIKRKYFNKLTNPDPISIKGEQTIR